MNDDELGLRLTRLGESVSRGAGLAGRVMRQVEPRRTFVMARRAALFAAAAALVTVVARPLWSPAPTAPTAKTVPVSQGPGLVRTSSQFQTVSQRPVSLDGETPAWQVNCDVFERTRWTDPRDHTSFERVVPLERSSLIQPVMY